MRRILAECGPALRFAEQGSRLDGPSLGPSRVAPLATGLANGVREQGAGFAGRKEVANVLVAVALCSVVVGCLGAAPQESRPLPPLVVTFTAPAEGEADVRLDTVIRIQFSRPLDERSLAGHVTVAYSAAQSAERGEAQPPALPFTLKYDSGTYAITITPGQRLERFRDVHVDLAAGIVSADGAALKPWTLRFSTGGSEW